MPRMMQILRKYQNWRPGHHDLLIGSSPKALKAPVFETWSPGLQGGFWSLGETKKTGNEWWTSLAELQEFGGTKMGWFPIWTKRRCFQNEGFLRQLANLILRIYVGHKSRHRLVTIGGIFAAVIFSNALFLGRTVWPCALYVLSTQNSSHGNSKRLWACSFVAKVNYCWWFRHPAITSWYCKISH